MIASEYLVIIPTYNESKNVKKIISSIQTLYPGMVIMFVDDNSPDKTGELIISMINDGLEGVHLLNRQKKLGIGSAYRDGFKQGLGMSQFKYFIQMDADLSHDPEEIKKLMDASKDHDLVIGSRYIDGMRVVNWPLTRMLISRLGNVYARLITGMKVHDATSGFTCISKNLLKKIQTHKITTNNYSFQVELKYRAWVLRSRIKEVPITFRERTNGKSKFTNDDIQEAALNVFNLRLRILKTKFRKYVLDLFNKKKEQPIENSLDSQDTE